ncbi:odorant receptor Or2 isoform X1 [Dendroctonus ponderosae]|nr:odorant receptor Or2 isoform X1 [Dendroctonus ponderosae]
MMTLHVRYPLNRNKYFFETYILSLSSTLTGAIYCTISQVYFIVLTAFVISQLKVIKRLARDFHLSTESNFNEEEALTAIRNIYNKHLYVIRFVHEVNLDIKYLILADCMVNSIIIAFLIVQVLFVTTSLSSLMFYVAVSCTVLSQIFIISWFANEIEVMSTSISDALFESHWWEQTEKVKRVISIIMMRSRKPLRIMIGPFYPLTIQTALNSLRAAYSYVTLIFAISTRNTMHV